MLSRRKLDLCTIVAQLGIDPESFKQWQEGENRLSPTDSAPPSFQFPLAAAKPVVNNKLSV